MVIITVPIYKSNLDAEETESLLQLFNVLGHYPICLFTFRSLDLSAYKSLLANKTYTVTYFDDNYFKSLGGYNLLMRSKFFYERFSDYVYLLIYQLDAWVFSDRLEFWCHQNYDYIGAPWFDDFKDARIESPFVGVGNGGFSLRKIGSHLKALSRFSYIKPFAEIWQEFADGPKTYKNFRELIRMLTSKNNTFYKFNDYDKNEDAFWGIIVNRNFKWYNVAGMKQASEFSFEVNASKIYAMNDHQLPFGCHALLKYDPDFFYSIK
jgi:hypothetical protein